MSTMRKRQQTPTSRLTEREVEGDYVFTERGYSYGLAARATPS
jgi:hypothetical protein